MNIQLGFQLADEFRRSYSRPDYWLWTMHPILGIALAYLFGASGEVRESLAWLDRYAFPAMIRNAQCNPLADMLYVRIMMAYLLLGFFFSLLAAVVNRDLEDYCRRAKKRRELSMISLFPRGSIGPRAVWLVRIFIGLLVVWYLDQLFLSGFGHDTCRGLAPKYLIEDGLITSLFPVMFVRTIMYEIGRGRYLN